MSGRYTAAGAERRKIMMQSIVSAIRFCDDNLDAYYRVRGRTVLVENA